MGLLRVLPFAADLAGHLRSQAAEGGNTFLELLRSPPNVEQQMLPVSQSNTQLQAEFAVLAQRLLQSHGINTKRPIHLQADGRGGVLEIGGHPDRMTIEEVFRQQPKLTSCFNELMQTIREASGSTDLTLLLEHGNVTVSTPE